ncbi:MAG: HAD family phosphatase [Prevotellaceae bacterium]|nr:HAD family phosphatase [Prevotellaceae bacterium]
MIKNLIFDFGGVVVPLNPEEAYRRFESLGVTDARQRLGKYGQTGIFLQCEDGSIDAATFQRELGRLVDDLSGTTDTEQFSFEQCEWAWRGYVTEVDPQRLQHLLELKERYNVLLLSNTNPFMMHWAESTAFSGDGHAVSHYFHRVFCSYRMKDYKPSPTIFRRVLAEANLHPDETLFLDDGPANIEAAMAEGIHGLLVPKNEDWWPMLHKHLSER